MRLYISRTEGKTRTGIRYIPTTSGVKEIKLKLLMLPEIKIKKPVITAPTDMAVIFSESLGKAKPMHLAIAEI